MWVNLPVFCPGHQWPWWWRGHHGVEVIIMDTALCISLSLYLSVCLLVWLSMSSLITHDTSLIARFMGQHGAHLGQTGPSWAPCWPYEPYYLGSLQPTGFYYPRPVLAFGYCHRLRLCVCPCVCLSVCQSLACPRDNSGPVQAMITKFRPMMQMTLVKVLIVFGSNWPWPSRSNLT